ASRSLERNLAFATAQRERGLCVHGMQFDLTDANSVGRLHDEVIERFGRVDVLVNSAHAPIACSFESATFADWDSSARGDMVGVFAVTRAFLRGMVERRKGSMINIASIYGMVGNDPSLYEGTGMQRSPHYNFVKAGLINFTRFLACYYGKSGVRVNA